MRYTRYYTPLPDQFIIPFEEYYNDVAMEMEFFSDIGVDCSVLFDEVINIVYSNSGCTPKPNDFDDIDYMWVSLAYDTFQRHSELHESEYDTDLEEFNNIYASVVEKIFICIYSDIEEILNRHGSTNFFTVRFDRFMHKDIILKVDRL